MIEASPTSRYPVYVDDLDHIIGILHVKDFVRVSQSDEAVNLTTLVRRLPTVGGKTSADVLLSRFRNERVHAALVVDDPAGDHDLPAVVHDDGSVTLDGETTLAELDQDHGFTFERDGVTTLAGLVLAQTGTVPRLGDRVEIDGHELTVEGLDTYKVTQVRISRPDAHPGALDPNDE